MPAYKGSCACGAVQIRIDGPALTARQCWCGNCQKLAGGGPMHNAFFRTDDIDVSGVVASHSYVADSGNMMHWYFCGGCGTPLFAGSDARPHMRAVRIGIFDRPHELKPLMAIWTNEAPSWAVIDPALEQYTTQPPPPAQSPGPVP